MKSDRNKPGSKPVERQPNPDKEFGEGNYKATREYNAATRKFVNSGEVDEAARNAEPQSAREQEELKRAEQEGRSRSKAEDPALYRGSRKSSDLK
jgi:hypothetical protein